MTRITPLAAAVFALVLPSVAMAQDATPPQGFTWLVLKGLNDLNDDPEDPTNGPPIVTEVPDGVLKPVDINHDGQTDWLIDWPESPSVCGTGGCLKSLYVSGPDGFTRALDRQVLEFDIHSVADEVRVEARVHHGECPTQEARGDWDCTYAWGWDEAARALIPRPTRAGVALMDGAGSPPVEIAEVDGRRSAPANLPAEVAAQWVGAQVICEADWTETGYSVTHPVISRLPDVDGDGIPDWSVVQPSACDSGVSSRRTRIWRTGAGDAATLIYESGEAARFRTDVSARPAVLSFSPSCDGEGESCRYVSLHWNAATQRLEPSA
jgi:hypothetical protein